MPHFGRKGEEPPGDVSAGDSDAGDRGQEAFLFWATASLEGQWPRVPRHLGVGRRAGAVASGLVLAREEGPQKVFDRSVCRVEML